MRSFFAAALAAAMLATPAAATVHTLSLNGTVNSGSPATVVFQGRRFDFVTFSLSGFSPLTLAVGDTVNATISFDQSLTVPGANLFNGADFFLIDTLGGPFTSTETLGTTDLLLGGTTVLSQNGGSATSNGVANGYFGFSGASFSFDTMISSFTVTALSEPTLNVDTALGRYFTANAVPEPASWAMLIIGFGLVGAMQRKRNSALAA